LPQNLKSIGILDALAQIRQYVIEVEPQTDLIVFAEPLRFEEDSLLAMQLALWMLLSADIPIPTCTSLKKSTIS
jgi:hypothetical protein